MNCGDGRGCHLLVTLCLSKTGFCNCRSGGDVDDLVVDMVNDR